MYNMQISIFGYKLDLEILILIGILYLILVGHTVCGCCNMPRAKKAVEGFVDDILEDIKEIKTSTTKVELKAYIEAWKLSLLTVKDIIKK